MFTAPSTPDHAPYVSTRHDVDAIVWLPSPETSSAQFSLNHVRTFNALGYVQALKANRKFTTVSPDLTYSVITDCGRHVFVYCQPDAGGGNKARADAGGGNKARPDVGGGNKARPDIGGENKARPDAGRGNKARPDTGGGNKARPDASGENKARPDIGGENKARPDAGRGNKARPDTGRGNKARELLHTLNDNTDILGVTAYNHGLLFILTSETLLGLMLPL